jgi:hypothetical protein
MKKKKPCYIFIIKGDQHPKHFPFVSIVELMGLPR